MNASTMPNKMMGKILWGGNLDPDFLREMRDKAHDKNNHLGYEFKNVLTQRWRQKGHSWSVGLKYRELFGVNYSKDLFGVVFLGNGAYEGQKADLSNTKFAYWQYTGLTFGWLKSFQELGQFYIGLSALYGINYQSLHAKNAALYTAPDAQYLQLDADFSLRYKEPGYGMGAGLNFGYMKAWKKSSFSLQVEDLGFMNWQNVSTYTGNGTYTYQGQKIENVLNFNGDSLFSDLSTTGFAHRFGIGQEKGSHTTLLPFSIALDYKRMFNEKWASSFQVYYTYMPAYLPRANVKAIRSFEKNWKASVGFGYGGFGKGNLLLGTEKMFRRNWSFQLDAYFLGMLILPNETHGIGLTWGIRKSF